MSDPVFTLNELNGQWRWICGQCSGHSRNFLTGQQAQDDFYARHAHVHCQRPECGGVIHIDGRGQPTHCPARRCPRCDCPDGHTQCDHCKTCPHADGAAEAPPEVAEPEHLRADNEALRYQIRRAREALATDEPNGADAAIARVRQLHREEFGCCEHCTGLYAVSYPCPTICAIDGQEAP